MSDDIGKKMNEKSLSEKNSEKMQKPSSSSESSVLLDNGIPPSPLQLSPNDVCKITPGEDISGDNIKNNEDDDTKLKQDENGTLLSCGGEFDADENSGQNNLQDSALREIQTTSDIRFFICGSCKNNPILIGCTPKLLPCLHSFCDVCLQKRYEKQKNATGHCSDNNEMPRLKCPSCGQEFLVAANEHPTSGFLNNQFVIESTPAHQNTSKSEFHQCTSCDDESTASSYCMNCNEWLCEACVNAHQRVKVTKDHIIQKKSNRNSPTPPMVDAEMIAKKVAKEKPLYCKIHPQEQLKLFCANCDKLTCRDCQLVEHKDHHYQFIDEAATKHREILKKLLQYLQINLGLLKETIQDVEKVSDGLTFQEKEIEVEINKGFQSLIDSIKARQDLLIKELRNIISGKQSLLSKQKKDLTQMKVILEHNHDFAEFAVKGGSNVALLYSRKVLGTRLHNLNSLKYRQRPLALTDLKFSMDIDKLCSYFNKIGAVFSHEDMQRKIDHGSSKIPSGTNLRTMFLSRGHSKPLTPIQSMAAVNKRISDNTAVSPSGGYINLSKTGSLGLPGHHTIKTSSLSPKNYLSYKTSSRHLSLNGGQEMIVLSSSNPKQNVESAKNNFSGAFYPKPSESHQCFPANYGSHTSLYRPQQNSVSTPSSEAKRILHKSENESERNKYEPYSHQNPSKNNGIDKIRKIVESTSITLTNSAIDDSVINQSSTKHRSNSANTHPDKAVKIKEESSPIQSYVDSNQLIQHQQTSFDDGQNEDYCGVCRNGGQLLCCDTCPKVYHLTCHVPQLNDLPSDSWSCGLCTDIGQETKAGQKRRHSDQMAEWENKLCEKLLLNLFVDVDSLPFHHKVSKTQAPDYYKVISKPMDLMTVLTKLNPNHFENYTYFEDFIKDIRLIFSNCFIYNSAESEVCKMGRRMESHFDALLKKYAPEVNSYPGNGPEAKRRKDEMTNEG